MGEGRKWGWRGGSERLPKFSWVRHLLQGSRLTHEVFEISGGDSGHILHSGCGALINEPIPEPIHEHTRRSRSCSVSFFAILPVDLMF